MSTKYIDIQFQPPAGLQPAVSSVRQTDCPLGQCTVHSQKADLSRTQERAPSQTHSLPAGSHAETSIHASQAAPVSGTANPQTSPPHAQPPPGSQSQRRQPVQWPEPDPQQIEAAELAYLAAYHPQRLQPVYHTIVDAPGVVPSHAPQQQGHRPPRGRRADSPQDESVQEDDEPDSDADADADADGGGGRRDTGDQSAHETEGTPRRVAAPLTQQITPLQLPSVRPTLLLGPYETCEEARRAAVEYAVAQG